MDWCMGVLPPNSDKSRDVRPVWPKDQALEPPPGKVLEPGDAVDDDAVDDDDAEPSRRRRLSRVKGVLPPKKSTKTRTRVRWPKDQTLEPEPEVLEPGDDGYEEADDPQGELTDD